MLCYVMLCYRLRSKNSFMLFEQLKINSCVSFYERWHVLHKENCLLRHEAELCYRSHFQ
jgi:hypothetical protein